MDKYTSPVSYFWGWLYAALGAFTLNEWVLLMGLLTTLGTFLVNWYYKHKDYQLKQRSVLREEKNQHNR